VIEASKKVISKRQKRLIMRQIAARRGRSVKRLVTHHRPCELVQNRREQGT
jgi:hypothetical protein